MELGFCPHCGALVVTVGKKEYSGEWVYDTAKRKQALKLFNDNRVNITDSLSYAKIKHGTKSNMGFRYGDNREIHNSKGKVIEIRRYAVDFNGTRELLKTIKI